MPNKIDLEEYKKYILKTRKGHEGKISIKDTGLNIPQIEYRLKKAANSLDTIVVIQHRKFSIKDGSIHFIVIADDLQFHWDDVVEVTKSIEISTRNSFYIQNPYNSRLGEVGEKGTIISYQSVHLHPDYYDDLKNWGDALYDIKPFDSDGTIMVAQRGLKLCKGKRNNELCWKCKYRFKCKTGG
jgi:hypothetical protein